MVAIPEEDRAAEVNVKAKKDTVTTTLGFQWNSTEDVFVALTTSMPFDYVTIKSGVLKKVTTIFDLLDLVSPFIMQTKIVLQEWELRMRKFKLKWLTVSRIGPYSCNV